MKTLEIRTRSGEEIVDLTSEVQEVVDPPGSRTAFASSSSPTRRPASPSTKTPIPTSGPTSWRPCGRAVPDSLPYPHSEGNSPAHVKASLIGSSMTVIVEGGRLRLGTWQGIQFCEFDGPRSRKLFVRVL